MKSPMPGRSTCDGIDFKKQACAGNGSRRIESCIEALRSVDLESHTLKEDYALARRHPPRSPGRLPLRHCSIHRKAHERREHSAKVQLLLLLDARSCRGVG